jgi:hypothetical protein
MFTASMRTYNSKEKALKYTEIEIKVRKATNNDNWGAMSTLMAEIAKATND